MRLFFKKIGYVTLLAIAMLYLLDTLYTYIYANPVHSRNKISWLKSIPDSKTYDYVLFGSSRCIHHVNPLQIEKETGLKGLNLAYAACNPFEIKLMVKEFLKNHNTDKIFIQVDNEFNITTADNLAIVSWMPFIKESSVYEDIYAVDSSAFWKRNIPFYRYMLYDSKIGFRDVSMSFFKPNKFEKLNGFVPIIKRNDKRKSSFEFHLLDQPNKHLDEVVELCKEKQVDLIFFTAPFYDLKGNTNVLKNHLPNYTDFSDEISASSMFYDNSHLNSEGAELFTFIFMDTYFK